MKNNSASIYSTMYLDDTNRFLLQKGWETMIDPVTGKELIFKNTDVGSYNFNTPALTQDYNINVSGGSEKGHYYAGLGYNKSEGLPLSSFYERYTFVFNGDYKIKDWLTSASSFNFARANWENFRLLQRQNTIISAVFCQLLQPYATKMKKGTCY